MTKDESHRKGKIIRGVAKADKAWRASGKPEDGRQAEELTANLGRAYRAGLGSKARDIQNRNAQARGERSGWER